MDARAAVPGEIDSHLKLHGYSETDRMQVNSTTAWLLTTAGTAAAIEVSLVNETISGASPEYASNQSGTPGSRTGWPVRDGFQSVSVMADACLLAGSATTVALLKGETPGQEWLCQLGFPYLTVSAEGIRACHPEGIISDSQAVTTTDSLCPSSPAPLDLNFQMRPRRSRYEDKEARRTWRRAARRDRIRALG